MSEIEELESSQLGTKDYWDKCYNRENKNYDNHGDVGEIWFDEDSQIRIINWILKCDSIQETDRIIDLGCGNGMILIELAREGYKNLIGCDYSSNAIELSTKIAKDQELDIEYRVCDLLNSNSIDELQLCKVAHDKGTYDAISLHPDNPKEKREIYISNILKLLADDGYFIITSCNWTAEELLISFANKFSWHKIIPTPTFQFGGKIGNVVTSIVFKK